MRSKNTEGVNFFADAFLFLSTSSIVSCLPLSLPLLLFYAYCSSCFYPQRMVYSEPLIGGVPKFGPIGEFMRDALHSFIPDIYIAPFQETYSEALSVQLRSKRNVLRSLHKEDMLF